MLVPITPAGVVIALAAALAGIAACGSSGSPVHTRSAQPQAAASSAPAPPPSPSPPPDPNTQACTDANNAMTAWSKLQIDLSTYYSRIEQAYREAPAYSGPGPAQFLKTDLDIAAGAIQAAMQAQGTATAEQAVQNMNADTSPVSEACQDYSGAS